LQPRVDLTLDDRLAAGCDAGVIEDLYDTYGALCYQVARRIVVDEHLAYDIVQDVFVAVWSGRAGVFDPTRGSVKVWLLRVTHHKAVDTVRRNHRHASRNAGPNMFSGLLASNNVEADVWERQQRTHIDAALADLSDVQREVLSLAYFGGYSQSEISRLTGIPLGTVKTRTLAALRQLRTSLDLLAIADEDGWTRAGSLVAAAR
jgi:RNA polymerase sigma factor (sigma-70 family)